MRRWDPDRLLALIFAALLLVLLFLAGVFAEGIPEAIVPPSLGEDERWPQSTLLVVDTSESMTGDPIAEAFLVFDQLTQQSTDEWQLGLVSFNSTGQRWPGMDGSKWAAMPDGEAVEAARVWLGAQGPRGNTSAWTGIELATREVPEGGLGVVVVSDGRWQDLSVVRVQLPVRLESRPGLVVASYTVGRPQVTASGFLEPWPRPGMLEVGRLGRGGAWR